MSPAPIRTHLGRFASEGSRLIAARLRDEDVKLRHLAERLARHEFASAAAAAPAIDDAEQLNRLRKRTDCFASALSRFVYGDAKPGRQTARVIAEVLGIAAGAWDEPPTSPIALPLDATGRRHRLALSKIDPTP